MAQSAAIDPALRPALSRPISNGHKRAATFAAALDDTIGDLKAKPGKQLDSARTQNREPEKARQDKAPSRKAEHPKHRGAEAKTDSEPAPLNKPSEESKQTSPRETEPDSIGTDGIRNAADTESDDDENSTDKEASIDAESATEIPVPVAPELKAQDNEVSPFQSPAGMAQSRSNEAEAADESHAIVPAPTLAEKAIKPIHVTPASADTEALQNGELQSIAQDKTSMPSTDADSFAKLDTQDNPTAAMETESLKAPTLETAPEKIESAQSGQAANQHVSFMSHFGAQHALHTHLSPDARPILPPPASTLPETSKSAPLPYHTLPIEIGLRALDGAKEISIDLTPKELGQLNILISVDDQSSIQVSISAEKPQTLALLQQDASHIRHALEQAGYITHESSLQFSMQNNLSSNSNSSRDDQRKSAQRRGANSDVTGIENETATPVPHRIYLNQLDLSV